MHQPFSVRLTSSGTIGTVQCCKPVSMAKVVSGSKNAGGLVALVVAGVIALISTGQLKVPLPAPAYGKYIHVVPQDVLPWRPQPMQGKFSPNTRLFDAVRLFEGKIVGAESVAVRANGDLALLDRSGNLFDAVLSSGSSSSWQLQEQPVARLGAGRPLGYHFDADNNLIVCDSLKGLVKYDYSLDQVSLLATHVSTSSPVDAGSEITYANDLAIASDGKVYFTSCTDIVPGVNKAGFYDTFRAWMLGLAQGLPQGKLLMYDPATQETVVLAKGFYYVNGVALSADESYLVLAETDRIRLLKYWLKGPKAGTHEPLIEKLPGPPDGVSAAPDGNFWVGLVSPIPPIAALLRDPTVRALYVWLPNWLKPPLKKWGAVTKVSGETGEVLDFLMDPHGSHISSVSAAVEHDGKLFLGNLAGDYVSYVDLRAPSSSSSSSSQEATAAAQQQRWPSGSSFFAAAAAAEVPAAAGEEQQAACELCESTGDEDVPEDDEAAGAAVDEGTSCSKETSCGAAAPAAAATGINHSPVDTATLWIHSKVAGHKVVVFSKSYCPYSMKAKQALRTLLQPHQMEVIELDQMGGRPAGDGGDIDPDAVQDALKKVTGARTVPRVFIGTKFIGGGDDTERLARSGKLRKALLDAGVELEQEDAGADEL